jgi:hypothetical protein
MRSAALEPLLTRLRRRRSTVDYRLGGVPLTATGGDYPLFPTRDTRVAALPTPSFSTFRDAASFASAAPFHRILLPAVAPGAWLVAVANARPSVLPASLRREAARSGLDWGAALGFAGGAVPMPFTLRAALSANADDLCPAECSGRGACLAGACVCHAAAAAAAAAAADADAAAAAPAPGAAPPLAGDAAPYAAWAGAACETPVVPIASGVDVSAANVSAGAFAHFWLPLNAATHFNADLTIELAHERSPEVRPSRTHMPRQQEGSTRER